MKAGTQRRVRGGVGLDGIFRYDGYELTIYGAGEGLLPNGSKIRIVEEPQAPNTFWFSTAGGLSCLGKVTAIFRNYVHNPVDRDGLADIGVQDPQIDATNTNGLIIAVVAETEAVVEADLGDLDRASQVLADGAPISIWHTFENGLAEKPEANLTVISIPAEYWTREACKAIMFAGATSPFSLLPSITGFLEQRRFLV